MEELDLGGDLTYSEWTIKILDMAERVTCNKVINICKFVIPLSEKEGTKPP
jgi:hypothetical protein